MKWKNVRASFSRELRQQKDEKNGVKLRSRRRYMYFDALRFLETIPRYIMPKPIGEEINVAINTKIKDEASKEVGEQKIIEKEIVAKKTPALKEAKEEEKISLRRPKRKMSSTDEDELIQILKKRIFQGKDSKPTTNQKEDNMPIVNEENEDRLFLLSLVTELHKVPELKKLKVKSDLMKLIYQAQQPYQQQSQSASCPGPQNSSGLVSDI